jgi:uncharacterized protein with ParB-like and HNH nuclease domain/predicted transport protein
MKASEAKLLDLLRKSPQFIIPIYQRTYSWTEAQCRQLWDDIMRAGRDEKIAAHFIGSIVYIQRDLYQVSTQTPLLVIDGQQRLTTVTLFIAALAKVLGTLEEGSREPVEGFSPRKLNNYYLVNPEEDGEKFYKLILSQTDKRTLTALVSGDALPTNASVRVRENFEFFEKLITASLAEIKVVCQGVAKLMVVDVALTRGQDNPQLIFESMNSTGLALTQADLIRNYVLMGLEPDLQNRLYQQYWRPMEEEFGQDAYSSDFDSFMRHYLTLQTGHIPNQGQVYEAFKAFAPASPATDIEKHVKEIRTFAGYYCAMALRTEKDPVLADAFHDLRELQVRVAYPFLLELYHDHSTGFLPKEDFLLILRLIESYVFRRAICSIPTNSLNKTFAFFSKALKKDRYLESVQAHFLNLRSYRRFPLNDEFQRELQTRDLYQFPRRTYWLRRIENHGRKERVQVNDYTIEHILPQNPNLSVAWQTALGPDWKKIQKARLHTLGNLTLTAYNSEYSDRSFPEKRDMEGGFKESPLHLNKGLGVLEQWNEDAIQQRAAGLATIALDVWSHPTISDAVAAAYKPQTSGAGYSIEDHPALLLPNIREVFEAFRKEVLALDPCVNEEFSKLYVAYKAETNFVDVIPQQKRLLLSLNMKFPDLEDPKHLCRDVTAMGRWGNGDVEVPLASLGDVPYVIGLVRQSFDQQMGNNTEA